MGGLVQNKINFWCPPDPSLLPYLFTNTFWRFDSELAFFSPITLSTTEASAAAGSNLKLYSNSSLSSSPSKLVWIVILAIITLSPSYLSPSYSYSSLLSRFYCHLHVLFHSPPLWTYIFVCSPFSSWIHVHISDHSHQQSPNKSLNQLTLNISTKAPFKQLRLVSKWSRKKQTCGKEQYLF